MGYCQSKRDIFLVSLLAETGLRIGQALCLQHQDIRSFDNEIDLIPRQDPTHPERNKTRTPYTVHVPSALMQAYSQYVLENPWAETNAYVFLKHKDSPIPMDYRCVRALFQRLSKKIGFKVTPHQLRHSMPQNSSEKAGTPLGSKNG